MEITYVVEVLYDSGVEKRYSFDTTQSREEVEEFIKNVKNTVIEFYLTKKICNGAHLAFKDRDLIIDLSKTSSVKFEIY